MSGKPRFDEIDPLKIVFPVETSNKRPENETLYVCHVLSCQLAVFETTGYEADAMNTASTPTIWPAFMAVSLSVARILSGDRRKSSKNRNSSRYRIAGIDRTGIVSGGSFREPPGIKTGR